MTDWWTQSQAGVVFGSLGGLFGILGSIVGCAVGIGAQRGRFKPLAYATHAIGAALGGAMLAVGVAALFAHQPYHVWYPPLLLGALGLGLFGGLFLMVTRPAYRIGEHRRLDASLMRGN